MANPLKIKLTTAGFAILILFLIPLLENNFFATVTIKRWGKITWDDFQGIPHVFSSYEAGISSSIYLEYDSSRGRYIAYAGQNNVQSWAKRSQEKQDYILNHEQYHFNITELHARMLNNHIEKNLSSSLESYLLRLGSLNIDLSTMQRRYDDETNHSLNYDKQRKWEYYIDSLMLLESGWVIDNFSGAKAFFSEKPELDKGFTDSGNKYRSYILNRYDMSLALSSFQRSSISENTLSNILNFYSHSGKSLRSVTIDSLGDHVKVKVTYQDTTGHTTQAVWLKDYPYLYCASARYPNNYGDTTGYALIAQSFTNSFSIVNTNKYWIEKLEKSNEPINFYNIKNHDSKKGEATNYCMGIGPTRQGGFYRGPFFRDDGAMFLAYDYLVHPDSLHFKDVLLLNNSCYSHTPIPEGQIYFVPTKDLPKQKYRINFGYLLKEDSVKECYEFYHEALDITPNANE